MGPQWSMSLSGEQGVETEPTGDVTLVAEDGSRVTFASDGKGGFVSPKGDGDLVLSAEWEGSTVKAYLLANPSKGTTLRFIHPAGASSSSLWVIEKAEGALSSENNEKLAYKWEAIEGVERPKEALAPAPPGVSCEPEPPVLTELKKGCRALSFTYATGTSATGEGPSEWGGYKGRLSKVSFTAYDPVGKAMKTTVVAEYAYDTHGRLRAEWDPRISPALKTTYGYDAENRVVAVDPPGHEPWLLHYGTIATDPNPGRLLSAVMPPASAKIESIPAPVNTAKPTLSSTTPVIGTTLKVSANGSWSNAPLTYTYQWEDCNSTGEKCAPIVGACNESYTPQASDAGYTLEVVVAAINGAGSGTSSTAATSTVGMSSPSFSLKFGTLGEASGQIKSAGGVAVDGEGNTWVADRNNNRLDEFSSSGTFVKAVGWGVVDGLAKLETCTTSCRTGFAAFGMGAFKQPSGIAISGSNIYVADSGGNRVEVMTTSGAFVRYIGSEGSGPGQVLDPVAVTLAAGSNNVWVADRSNNRIDEFTETGSYLGSFGVAGSGAGQMKEPSGIAFSRNYVYVVDAGNSRVERFTMSGGYVEAFGSSGTGNGQFKAPAQIATEPVSGDLYVADSGNNRIEQFNPAGGFVLSYGAAGEGGGQFKGVEGLSVTSAGGLYVADSGNNRVQVFTQGYSTNNPAPAPPSVGSNAVSTVDYQIPVSGSTAPYQLSSAQVSGWAQEDDPVIGTAVFPPDEPKGWPANGYTKATISYYDNFGRTVNVANPSGGISTAEYNETGDITRSLSPADRAKALAEGAKSAEVAKLLDTRMVYNASGTELLENLGPRHLVRLANGEEKQARVHVHNYYDEGAPGGQVFGLLTKKTEGAQYEEHEADIRTTVNSYRGQEGLGWTLRKPTSVTTDPGGLNLTKTEIYDPASGDVTETRTPAAGPANGPTNAYAYFSQVTSAGTEGIPLVVPYGVALDSGGHLWITESGANSQVYEMTSTGEVLNQFGTQGTGSGQFKVPHGIAVDAKGNVWVADWGNGRIQEFSSSGTLIRMVGKEGTGNGEFKDPNGVALDASGNVWVGDAGNNRVQEFTSEGVFVRKFGSSGTGEGQFATSGIAPEDGMWLAFDASGHLWVTDSGNNRVQEFSSTGTFMTKFGTVGTSGGQFKYPQGIGIDPSGHIWVVDYGNRRVQEFSSSGTFMATFGSYGAGNGQYNRPQGLAVDASNHVWVADITNKRVQELGGSGEYLGEITQAQTPPIALQFPYGVTTDSSGHMWATNFGGGHDKVYEFSSSGSVIAHFGTEGTGNGQLKVPHDVAVDAKGNVWVTDFGNSRVEEFSSTGAFVRTIGSVGSENGQFKTPSGIAVDSAGNIWVGDAGNNRVQEFTSEGVFVRKVGYGGTGEGQFATSGIAPEDGMWLAFDSAGHLWVTDSGNNRVQEFSSTGTFMATFGTAGTGNGQFKYPQGIAFDSAGHMFVVDFGNSRIQEFTSTGTFIAKFATRGSGEGQLSKPQGIGAGPNGDIWVGDMNNARVEEYQLTAPNPRVSQAVYYSAAANSAYPSCGEHAEWANLPCTSQPVVQPVSGNQLPVVTDTYNVWDEPEVVVETVGTTTRTKKSVYDAAGRLTGSEETTNAGSLASLPTVTDVYNASTGAMVKQSTTVAEKTQTITSVYNSLGQLTEYIDANGNKSTYAYDVDGRVSEMNDGKGTQVYAYDPTTGSMTKLLDTGAGTFTAGYDVEGKLTSEKYPNGMTAKYVYDETDQVTHEEYVKETHCTEACVWFSEGVGYSVHGEALSRTNGLASTSYTYDAAGRLTQVQETPAGKGCVTRLYSYDADANRLGLTKREPATGGECASTGGTVESHTYDEVDRLSDTGVAYDAFGNITTLPATDAGGHEIKSTYYVSGQTHSAIQNGKTNTYNLDPDARVGEAVSEEGATKTTAVNHYPGPGEAVAWSNEGGEKYTRNIPGIDGALSAVEQNGSTPVLQLHDLVGDIVATAALSESEAKLLSTYASTEFGVPSTSNPPKYSWLGAAGVATEFASGANASAGVGYVPQLGRALQTQPITPPGASPDGSYISPYISSISAADWQASAAYAAEAPMRQAAREQAAYEAALAAGGEDIDPYFGQKKAVEVGERLKAVDVWSEVWGGADALLGIADPVGSLIGFVVAGVSLEGMQAWMHDAGEKLERCGLDREQWVSGCDIKYKTVYGFIDFYSPAEVEKCGVWVWSEEFVPREAWECRRLNQKPGPV